MAQKDITLRVLKSIESRIADKEDIEVKAENIPERKALVVFTGSNIHLKDRVKELRELRDKGIQISLAFSFMAERILDLDDIVRPLRPLNIYKEEDVFQLEDLVEEYHLLIGPNITTNTLSKVALGIIDSFIPTLIWTYLYRKKPVYLDFSSARDFLGVKSDNKKINGMLDSYVKTLLEMGAVELIPGRYVEVVDNRRATSSGSVDKKIITEKDISALKEGDKLVLPRGTILTPLAKEKAKLLGIGLEIEK